MDKIGIDIDCTKITKARLKHGKYLKATMIPTPNNKYGSDFMIVEATTREEYEAGTKGAIIGNARHLILKKQDDAAQNSQPKRVESGFDADDDLPF